MTREKKKEERRRIIVDAAELLIRKHASTEFSVQNLAECAGLSVASLYNLIGTKSTVLYTLLNLSLDRIDSSFMVIRKGVDPFDHLLDAADIAANAFTEDPELLRPLYRFLLGVADPIHRPAFMKRALDFWVLHLAAVEKSMLLPKGLTRLELARDYQIFFAGALDLWVQGELSDRYFRAQITHGSILRLLSLGVQPKRAKLIKKLQTSAKLVRQAILESYVPL